MNDSTDVAVPTTTQDAILAVMDGLGAFRREGHNETAGWTFIGIDQLVERLTPLLVQNKLTIVPRVIEHSSEDRMGFDDYHNGAMVRYCTVVMEYAITGPDGKTVYSTVVGQANDAYDKAMNKAMSAAQKYFLRNTFWIITDGTREDPDSSGTQQNGAYVTRGAAAAAEAGAKDAFGEKPAGEPPTTKPAGNLADRVRNGGAKTTGADSRKVTEGQRKRIWAITDKWGWNEVHRVEWLGKVLGRDINELEDLTFSEAKRINDLMNEIDKKGGPDGLTEEELTNG